MGCLRFMTKMSLAFLTMAVFLALSAAGAGGATVLHASLSTEIPANPSGGGSLSAPVPEVTKGKLLVASPYMNDPVFSRSVVIIIDYSAHGVTGLIINRPTKIGLAAALTDLKGIRDSGDPLYFGGPVNLSGVTMLVRAPEQPQESVRVTGDVYFSASPGAFRRLFDDDGSPKAYRVFAGFAGWAPEQFAWELSNGGWMVMDADPDVIFDGDPRGLWPRLIDRFEAARPDGL